MFSYLYTNDMRISELTDSIKRVSSLLLSGQEPYQVDKSFGNNGATISFYFNLQKGTKMLEVASKDPIQCIRNFSIKFQFPNTRTQDSLSDVRKEGFYIAPLRELINILFYQCLVNKTDTSFITKEEFLYFVMSCPRSYMEEYTDYNKIIEGIKEARNQDKDLSSRIQSCIKWKQYDRQARELMNILPFASKCFVQAKGRIEFNMPSMMDPDYLDDLGFIYNAIHYNKYWVPSEVDFAENHASYVSYMDIGGNTPIHNIEAAIPPASDESTHDLSSVILSYLTAIRTKPFLLLAGISGTGKSRIVRKLAQATDDIDTFANDDDRWKLHSPQNFQLIQVKPNWHNSMDLVGFKSNIGGEHYEMTPFIEFVAKAWQHQDTPFFLCLDEMNLAPVEEYFAEFLSAIESRSNEGGSYETDPIIKPFRDFGEKVAKEMIDKLLGEELESLKAEDIVKLSLTAQRFLTMGLTLPKNLIVMGTVNMDETTFSFSRKVLDRAMSIEMNEVMYDDFLSGKTENDIEVLVERNSDLVNRPISGLKVKDEDSQSVINFLTDINALLDNTPYKLGYRAANEALLYVSAAKTFGCDDWKKAMDDFTLMKILSRIEGDDSKLKTQDGKDLLSEFKYLLSSTYGFSEESKTIKKLNQMINILDRDKFVSFWG